MSTKNPSVTIARIDHGVLPSNDLGRAFRFWSGFMGARVEFLTNMNARGLNREVPLIVFFAVATHPGYGLALQDFRLAKPVRALEGVVWAFEVAATDLSAANQTAEKQKLTCQRIDIPHRARSKHRSSSLIRTATLSSCASEKIRRSSRRKAT